MVQQLLYSAMRILVHQTSSLLLERNLITNAPLPKGAKILAANHPTTIDPVMLTTIARDPVRIMISETLFEVPLLGAWLRGAGHIRIEHGHGQGALDGAVKALEAGQTVAIFPEGAISPVNGLERAHRGVARLALLTGAPVVPIGIHVSPDHIKRIATTVNGKPDMGIWYFSGPYVISVGEAMHFTGDADDRDLTLNIAETVMQRITELKLEAEARLPQRPALLNQHSMLQSPAPHGGSR
jgi:1-acyl-sn-glycerol-3-phosphate acyltransferase